MKRMQQVIIFIFLITSLFLVLGCKESTYRPPPEPICGNGKIEGDEECDDGNTNALDGCSPFCKKEGLCGNGKLEVSEQCDGSDFGGINCQSLGFSSGTILCTKQCKLDVSKCLLGISYTCGNGLKEEGEECDKNDFGSKSCSDFGFQYGKLQCTSKCKIETSLCTNTVLNSCGDFIKEGLEECDGTDFGGNSCITYGYDGGNLRCTEECLIDKSECHKCGNGIKEAQEVCDGTDFGGVTCLSLGFAGGELKCTQSCLIETNGCFDLPDNCDIYDDSSCPGHYKCLYDKSTEESTCVQEGQSKEGYNCNASIDCESQNYCMVNAYSNIGQCRRLCHGNQRQYDTQDCTGGEGSRCLRSSTDPGFYFCTINCNPLTNEGCEAGFNCLLYSMDGQWPTTECIEGGEPCGGWYCNESEVCVVYQTDDGNEEESCFQWCRLNHNDCPTNMNCSELYGNYTLDGTTWGACF